MDESGKNIDRRQVLIGLGSALGAGALSANAENETAYVFRLRQDEKAGPSDIRVETTSAERTALYQEYNSALQRGVRGAPLEELRTKLSAAEHRFGTALREYERAHGHASYPRWRVTKTFDDFDRKIHSSSMTEQQIEAEIESFIDVFDEGHIDRISIKSFLCGYYGVCQTN
jgi:hypothetical protein